MDQTIVRGILIAVEGIDGSGKSTLAKNLSHALTRDNFSVLLTKEPGGTALGSQLRAILHTKEVAIAPKAEYFLFASDRANHSAYVVLPALERKMIVISDRMGDSSVVYQGYARGLSTEMIQTINRWAMNDREPDLTLYVRIDVNTALARMKTRNIPLTSFEKEGKIYFQKCIDGFDQLYAQCTNVIILDGATNPIQLAHEAQEKLIQWMQQQNLLQTA